MVASPNVTQLYMRDTAATVQGSVASTAPAAGTTLVTLTAPFAGNWELVTWVVITTAVGAVDAFNISVTVAGNVVANVPTVPALSTLSPQAPMTFLLPVGGTVTLKAIANATATSIYNVTATLRNIA